MQPAAFGHSNLIRFRRFIGTTLVRYVQNRDSRFHEPIKILIKLSRGDEEEDILVTFGFLYIEKERTIERDTAMEKDDSSSNGQMSN